MRTVPLRVLTWGTAAMAVSSAVWLSSISQAALLCSVEIRSPADAVDFDDLAPWTAPSDTAPAATPLAPPSSSS